MKTYVGDQSSSPYVRIQDGGSPRPLDVLPYPYERGAGGPASIAWWEGHDAAIRLAASILADATGGALDPYSHEVLVTPASVAALGLAAAPVPTYVARAFADEIVYGFAARFALTEADVLVWLAEKGIAA